MTITKIGSHAITQELRDLIDATGGGGGGLSALPIQDDGVFVISGTAISFDEDLTVNAVGTVAHVEVTTGVFASGSHTHPIGSTAIQIFEDGAFKVTGTAINFTDGFEIVASGTVAHIQVPGYDEARYLGVYNYYEPGGAANYRIASVKSPNLRDWEKVTEPILGLGTGGQWDDVHLRCPRIVEVNGIYYVTYEGYDGSVWKIGLAQSFDGGATFQKYASNPILVADQVWEGTDVTRALILYDEDEPDVNSKWKMWYVGNTFGSGGIGYAYSSSGTSWTKYGGNPVVNLGTAGQWDDTYLDTGAIIKKDGTYLLFYGGKTGNAWSAGLVTFTNPTGTYTRSPYNPLIQGDGKTSAITSTVAVGATIINVANAQIFDIGMAVWVYDAADRYLTRVKRRVSDTAIEVTDPAPDNITSVSGNVESVASGSTDIKAVLYKDGYLFSVTTHQPLSDPIGAHELSALAYSDDDLHSIKIDYSAGVLVPITLSESRETLIAQENLSFLDTWRASKRIEPDERFTIAIDEIWDAKGDLVVGSGSNAAMRLPVGTDGHVLTADSTQALGVKWAAVSGSSSSPSASVPTYPAIYDDGAFVATGTAISFDNNLTVVATGTSVFVSSPISTYQRTAQPLPLEGLVGACWQVPEGVFASGSLAVFLNGLIQRPSVDYEEQFFVSGTYRYLTSIPTGSFHVVIYGIPCRTQIQPSTGTGAGTFAILDSNDNELLDSNSVQILDSNG